MKRIAIIGGGASGMAASISAARILNGRGETIIFERNPRVGKKLLSTGNGRCNLTNNDVSSENFLDDGGGLLDSVLSRCDVKKTLAFFDDCGLYCKCTSGGRIYPYHEQAAAVLDVLRFEIERLGVRLVTEKKITDVKKTDDRFKLTSQTPLGAAFFDCDLLIVSTGGKAAPNTGSDGSGFVLMESLGHRISNITPALTQLKTENTFIKGFSGTKVVAELTLKSGGKVLSRVSGEVIFTAYGLSGSAVFDISGRALANAPDIENQNTVISIDLFPDIRRNELISVLTNRCKKMTDLPISDFLTGFVNKRIGQAVCRMVCRGERSMHVSGITASEIGELADLLKNIELRLKGHTGWDNAQTNHGGLNGGEFDPLTLESRVADGLYATGELFGFAGACGGYNLQWAWSSGIVAGEAAARVLLRL